MNRGHARGRARVWGIGIAVLAVLVALGVGAAARRALSPQQAAEPTTAVSTQNPDEVIAYWTQERMRQAKPMPMPTPDEP